MLQIESTKLSVFLKLFVFLFTTILTSSLFGQTTNQLFDSYKEQILINLEEDPSLNIEFIDQIVGNPEFQKLSCFEKGKIFHYLGVSYYFLDREEEAISVFLNRSLRAWRSCPEASLEERANTVYNIGIAYQYTEKYLSAKSYLDRSFKMLDGHSFSKRPEMIDRYIGAANYYFDVGDFESSDLYFKRALNQTRQLQLDKSNEFSILQGLLTLNIEYEKYNDAFSYYDQLEEIMRDHEIQLSNEERAELYLNGAKAQVRTGDLEKGELLAKNALRLIEDSENFYLISIAYETLGFMALENQDPFIAKEYFLNSLSYRDPDKIDIYSRIARANALENLGAYFEKQGELDSALTMVNRALKHLCQNVTFDTYGSPIVGNSNIENVMSVVRLLSIKANLLDKKYLEEESIAVLQRAIVDLNKIDTLVSEKIHSLKYEISQIGLFELIENYYGQGIELNLKAFRVTNDFHYFEDAYLFSSRSKGLILQSQLTSKDQFDFMANKEEKETYSSYRKMLLNLENELEINQIGHDSLLEEYLSLQQTTDLFLDSILVRNNNVESLLDFNTSLGVSELQEILHPSQVIIEYFVAKDGIYVFWISSENAESRYITKGPLQVQKIDTTIASFTDPSSILSDKAVMDVSNYLMIPELISTLKNIRDLIIIPDGFIHRISFDLLKTNRDNTNSLLINKYNISYAYSNRFLIDETPDQLKDYIGFGSNYGKDLNTLLHRSGILSTNNFLPSFVEAEDEIATTAQVFDGTVYIGKDASLENFSTLGSNSDILHLSLHGLVNFESPNLSCIVFDQSNDPFLLTSNDLRSLKLDSEVVILSSCHSASGRIYRGEGVFGMSRTFLSSGAESVISSLWSATESSSSQILVDWAKNIKGGMSKSEALRTAKLNYLENASPYQKHPFFWANYVLIGDLENTENAHNYTFIILVLFFSFIISFLAVRAYVSSRQ